LGPTQTRRPRWSTKSTVVSQGSNQRRATEAKPGPDHEVIDALSNVSLGNWTKYQDFIDAVAELPDVLWIEMTNTQNDGLMVLFGEGTNNAR
jgi:hypothetical protein